jgi:hypothetical protein
MARLLVEFERMDDERRGVGLEMGFYQLPGDGAISPFLISLEKSYCRILQ